MAKRAARTKRSSKRRPSGGSPRQTTSIATDANAPAGSWVWTPQPLDPMFDDLASVPAMPEIWKYFGSHRVVEPTGDNMYRLRFQFAQPEAEQAIKLLLTFFAHSMRRLQPGAP